jgi:carbon monoxide dehydrogenase subunit G
MRLESAIAIHRKSEEVWRFLTEPRNLAKWDRGVATVEIADANALVGVGFEFNTIGHAGNGTHRGRMAYRISEADPEQKNYTVELTSRTGNARFFSAAQWRIRVEDAPEGSRVTCSTEFRLRVRYLMFAPVLRFMKRAIDRDLLSLKNALEKG